MARFMLPILLLTAGCFWEEQQTTMVPHNPFGFRPAAPPTTRVAYTAPSVDVAARGQGIRQGILQTRQRCFGEITPQRKLRDA